MDKKRLTFMFGGVMVLAVCGICSLCIFPVAFLFSPVRYTAQAYGPQADQPFDSSEMSGEALFKQYECAACHQSSELGPGPSLVGIYNESVTLEDGSTILADEAYLRRSILDSQAEIVAGYPHIMPKFDGQISEAEMDVLVEYIQSLDD